MTPIRYLGPAHRLITTEGVVVLRGQVAEVSDQEADSMAASPHTWVEFVDDSDEIELSVPSLVEALAMFSEPDNEEPEADDGEGQLNEEKEQ